VTIFDVGSVDGSPYIVMELLEGETLRDALGGDVPSAMPVRKAVEYATQIASALAVAHENGITHRDLEPENIFITEPCLPATVIRRRFSVTCRDNRRNGADRALRGATPRRNRRQTKLFTPDAPRGRLVALLLSAIFPTLRLFSGALYFSASRNAHIQ
jgi:serine/threonine protein kinase